MFEKASIGDRRQSFRRAMCTSIRFPASASVVWNLLLPETGEASSHPQAIPDSPERSALHPRHMIRLFARTEATNQDSRASAADAGEYMRLRWRGWVESGLVS